MSGSQVAYHLRVNKYIDRQLFVESLDLVNRYMPLADHGYVSMSGAYLEDCRVIHLATRISRMYSFDTEEAVIARQEINCPYGFIQCNLQTSKEVVEDLDSVRASFGDAETRLILWLDYVRPAERFIQLQEVETLVPKLVRGDIARITMNAHRTTLGENHNYLHLPLESRPSTLAAWRLAKLREQLGGYLPPGRDNVEYMEDKDGFYLTMIQSLRRVVIRRMESRPELNAFPILATAYDDQHGMITVTFVVLHADEVDAFKARTRWDQWPHKPGIEWGDFTEIQVPHLSLRERHVLHRAIRRGGDFTDDCPGFVTADEFEQYRKHYLRYPTFAPLEFV